MVNKKDNSHDLLKSRKKFMRGAVAEAPPAVHRDDSFRHRFELRKELGRGAAGEVHLAYDTYLQREVALKLTRTGYLDNPQESIRNRKMWLNETRLAGKLQHPFIVQIFEACSTDEFDYLVMEYVPGGTLKQHTSFDNLLPISRLIDILYKVCNALDYSHKMGILHRDIKPSNVLLGENNAVKVSDFGAAFLFNSDTTQVDMVGTLPFMPPEQFAQARPSMQSDVYAVGVMAYQLLTGMLPFTAKSYDEMIYQKLHEEALPLEKRRLDIPQALRFAVHRAMHRDKDMRYSSWKAFCDDLAAALPSVERPDEVRFDSAHFDVLRNLVFFAHFTDNEVWETVGISQWQQRKAGEYIVREGEISSSLFLIVNGEASVTKSDVELTRMHAGSCFGEIAYLDEARHARLATVRAVGDMSLIMIEGESLQHASDGLQASFAKAFLNLMIARITDTDRRLLSVLLAQPQA
ncbi:MAG: cyclic nucleotide-binding domain-containing protein [Gallionellaceae bacterium]|nr:MAG: cyclic nucleotide-binding domain-containing protein [Gallionellaceae bacterium]